MTPVSVLISGRHRLLHVARAALGTIAAGACAGYGVWSWVRGPRVRLPLQPEEVHRVVVIRVDLLGDLLFSLPTIDALAAAFPGARVDVLVLPYTAPLLADRPSVGIVHELDVNRYRRPRGLTELRTLTSTIQTLRRERYDLAVCLSGLVGGVLAVASGARVRVGYRGDAYWGCYNVGIAGARYDRPVHEVDYELELVSALGVRSESRTPRLQREISPVGHYDARAAGVSGPYAVLIPGASNGSAKRWPAPHWSALGDRLARERGLGIVLVGAAVERALAEEVVSGMSGPARNLAGATNIAELSDVLAGAAIVLAGDTGPLHLAAALDRPVIGIYGPTDPTNTGPLASRALHLRLGLACSPCYDLHSPAECKLPDRSVPCMWGLGPERVFAAACRLLDSAVETSAASAPADG